MAELWVSILFGVIEGVTEFLPISSTGHLLLAERWLGSSAGLDSEFWKRFVVFIQIGAIAAVVVYFRERILQLLTGGRPAGVTGAISIDAPPPVTMTPIVSIAGGSAEENSVCAVAEAAPAATEATADMTPLADPIRAHPLLLIAIATAPVLLIGFLTHKFVEYYLETPRVIAAALIAGGVAMMVIEQFRPVERTADVERISLGQALFIGLVQVLAAVFPGTSRSAATIMGGLLAGLSRPAAAEFSFFLAIPSMAAACAFTLLKMVGSGGGLTLQMVLLLIVGTLTSFLVALAVIAGFMSYIRRFSFFPFAVYRVVLGVAVLWLIRG